MHPFGIPQSVYTGKGFLNMEVMRENLYRILIFFEKVRRWQTFVLD